MLIRFELKMDGVGSWNGIDTGAKPDCFVWRDVPKKKAEELDGKVFHYSFGDGWWCNVHAERARRSKTSGFRGYDWMVDEILQYGKILTRSERKEKRQEGTYQRK